MQRESSLGFLGRRLGVNGTWPINIVDDDVEACLFRRLVDALQDCKRIASPVIK